MTTATERKVNVGETERVVSAIVGGALVGFGLARMSRGGLLVAVVGAALGYRGITGHCDAYAKLGIDAGGTRRNVGNLGVKIDESIVVDAPAQRVYDVWRRLEHLPRLLSHVERVEVLDRTRSRWTVKGPAGTNHAGSVTFEPAGAGTRVRVSLQYDPPGGRVGHAAASLVSADAGSQVAHDLAEFKRALEEGRLAA